MAGKKGIPTVLAAARTAALRRWVTSALTPEFAVCEKDPKDLTDTAPLLDAVAAVVWLDSEDDIESLEILGSINRLPCSNHVILMIDNVDEEILAAALDRLAPAQVVGLPTRPMVLRYAVRNTIPGLTPGQGARANHRPAPPLLAVSSAIREVIDPVRQIAPTNIPALILGETGTGKELVARAIHEQSPRASGPFVAVNCGAMPDSLLESELFGHRRGSFTGAHTDKSGLFEYADGGTIFLDEVGDTSPALQMKLLRVLENKEVRPLGDTRTIYVDVRIVSATHRDLEARIEEGAFRQDLYYRLNAATIHVPPLRRRRVDIPFLAQHFAEEFGVAHARRITLSEDLIETLGQRSFPGNVRELRNSIERAIALTAPGEAVTLAHLQPERTGNLTAGIELEGPLKELVDRVETKAIEAALEGSGGNRRKAADALGLTRPGLRYKMRRLGLEDAPPL
ncbi:MAG: sigma-54-dependent Fis family transcriptional regulator [Myxococcales bacterium]|nr:sigma-54-dependent Fis family transcriptional regulator [Myxococcales bacterium]